MFAFDAVPSLVRLANKRVQGGTFDDPSKRQRDTQASSPKPLADGLEDHATVPRL
jgi:hypothetical protein